MVIPTPPSCGCRTDEEHAKVSAAFAPGGYLDQVEGRVPERSDLPEGQQSKEAADHLNAVGAYRHTPGFWTIPTDAQAAALVARVRAATLREAAELIDPGPLADRQPADDYNAIRMDARSGVAGELREWAGKGFPSSVGSPTPEVGTRHVYLSTACLHGQHEHCRSTVAADGHPKTPGTCKFCAAICVCTECDHADPSLPETQEGDTE